MSNVCRISKYKFKKNKNIIRDRVIEMVEDYRNENSSRHIHKYLIDIRYSIDSGIRYMEESKYFYCTIL